MQQQPVSVALRVCSNQGVHARHIYFELTTDNRQRLLPSKRCTSQPPTPQPPAQPALRHPKHPRYTCYAQHFKNPIKRLRYQPSGCEAMEVHLSPSVPSGHRPAYPRPLHCLQLLSQQEPACPECPSSIQLLHSLQLMSSCSLYSHA